MMPQRIVQDWFTERGGLWIQLIAISRGEMRSELVARKQT